MTDTIANKEKKTESAIKSVVVAVDSFKGSMSSLEAGNAIKRGIMSVNNKMTDIRVVPIADGGEGTVQAITYNKPEAQLHTCVVTGPLGYRVEATYTTWGDKAFIEMASAAGLTLVPEKLRNPMNTTTYGVGELIVDACKNGFRKFIIGIGGSATNDGGVGMLQALGYRFVDDKGCDIPFGANGLRLLNDIYFENVIPGLRSCTFDIMCDVKNPLLGENGCSNVFAPQKGADKVMVSDMERYMTKYANLVEHINLCDFGPIKSEGNRNTNGAGAAGGLGYAFLMFLNGRLRPGIDIVLEETGIEKDIKNCDLVITGEGKLDCQSLMGKAPYGVATLAKRYGKKVIAIAGCVDGVDSIKDKSGEILFDEVYSVSEIMGYKGVPDKQKSQYYLEKCASKLGKR
jgi:glycerate kinase